MELNMELYHSTNRKNLPDILKHGLIPKEPQEITEVSMEQGKRISLIKEPFNHKGVYVSTMPFAWMHSVTAGSREAGACIEIDPTGITFFEDHAIFDGESYGNKNYYCLHWISPMRFKHIMISADNKPTTFFDLNEIHTTLYKSDDIHIVYEK